MRLTLSIVLIFLLAGNSIAFVSVTKYEELRTTPLIRAYIHGVAVGYESTNAFLADKGSLLMYCKPESLPLNEDNYIDILENTIADNKAKKKHNTLDVIEVLLLEALIEIFPCR